MDIEITNRCHGGCLFCFSGSTYGGDAVLPRKLVLSLIDEAAGMGLKQVLIIGGEPLLIPEGELYARHILDRGMRAVICSAGDMYTEKVARTTCENNVVFDLCRGCRAHADMFLGDYQASDPLCWMNPEAKGFQFNDG